MAGLQVIGMWAYHLSPLLLFIWNMASSSPFPIICISPNFSLSSKMSFDSLELMSVISQFILAVFVIQIIDGSPFPTFNIC